MTFTSVCAMARSYLPNVEIAFEVWINRVRE